MTEDYDIYPQRGYFVSTMRPWSPLMKPVAEVVIMRWTKSKVTVKNNFTGGNSVKNHSSSYGNYYRASEKDEAMRFAKQYWRDQREKHCRLADTAADMLQKLTESGLTPPSN